MRYLIYTPFYDQGRGGVMALHKLCHLLRSQGQEAWVVAMYNTCQEPLGWRDMLGAPMRWAHVQLFNIKLLWQYTTAPDLDTPRMSLARALVMARRSDVVVVYPEIQVGNPLRARHVVRWLMHNPGHFYGRTGYGKGELLIRYSPSFAKGYEPPQGSVLSPNFLGINHYMPCFCPPDASAPERHGTAYCVRKGWATPRVADDSSWTLVDNLSLTDTAEVLKRSERFVSYDPITALSFMALLCHCPSHIILPPGVDASTYRPDPRSAARYAYGLDDSGMNWTENFVWAEGVRKDFEAQNIHNVRVFIQETSTFFH